MISTNRWETEREKKEEKERERESQLIYKKDY